MTRNSNDVNFPLRFEEIDFVEVLIFIIKTNVYLLTELAIIIVIANALNAVYDQVDYTYSRNEDCNVLRVQKINDNKTGLHIIWM